jgi:SPOR domain
VRGGLLFADELTGAAALEQKGQTDQAIALYRGWLEANKPGAEWDRVLLHTVDLLPDPLAAAALLQGSIPKLQSNGDTHTAYIELAHLEELLGNLADAQAAYQQASLVPGAKDYESLLRSAALYLQLGDVEKASAQARAILEICQEQSIVTAARVLLAQTYAAQGDTARARSLLESLLAAGTSDSLTPPELLQLHDVCTALGFVDLADRSRNLLAGFPSSPEFLVASGKAQPYPSPTDLLGFQSQPYLDGGGVTPAGGAPGGVVTPAGVTPAATVGSDTPQKQPAVARSAGDTASLSTEGSGGTATAPSQRAATLPPSTMIQIGSYQDRTNAEYRLKDLSNAGFPGKILTARRNGTTYYKVVVPNVAPADSQTYLIRLKDKGFEGFLLSD